MPAGRPTKHSEATVKKITDVLRISGSRKSACLRGGISQDTMAVWLRKFPSFAQAVLVAENDAELALVATIRTAAEKSWQAAAWLLGRRRPLEWSARVEEQAFKDQVTPVLAPEERLARLESIFHAAATRTSDC